jgi:predicted nicotinamide N-methyase
MCSWAISLVGTFSGISAFHPFVLSRPVLLFRPFSTHYMSSTHAEEPIAKHHLIKGHLDCVEIKINLPKIGVVTLLEATAETQDFLVESAIEDDTDQLPSGDPYGAVLWPASLVIASRLLEFVSEKRVLELGAGTGLVSLAAALGGAKSVLATDYESLPLTILEYSARELNEISVGPGRTLDTAFLDLCELRQPLPAADVVVAADVMYEPATGKALAHRVLEAMVAGSRVLVGDSPGRAGRPAYLEELRHWGVEASFVDTLGSTVQGKRNDLICGPDSPTVSSLPKALTVAVMDLLPEHHQGAISKFRNKSCN